MRIRRIIGMAFVLDLCFIINLQAQIEEPAQFTDISANLGGIENGSIAWGDYDNDGDLDILFAGRGTSVGVAGIYRNDGDDGFVYYIVTGLAGVEGGSTAWGDYDNDGDLDILLTGREEIPISRVYRNDGPAPDWLGYSCWNFTDVKWLKGVDNSSVAWGDYDNDGDLDILLAGAINPVLSGPDIAKIYRNDGPTTDSGWNFTDISAGLAGVNSSSVAWGDYDNDGDLDILLTGRGGSTWTSYNISRVYRNDGPAPDSGWNFTDIAAGLAGIATGSVAWGDYDNDGDLDILLAGYTECCSPAIRIARVYRNDGDDGFTDISAGLEENGDGSVAWGDYDNDGDLDILLTGGTSFTDYARISRVYRNNGGDDFTDISAELPGVLSVSAVWGDYDNDGDLDILLAGRDSPETRICSIYRNNNAVVNTAPAAPSGLVTFVRTNRVTLSWKAATDNETPAAGLTYNLRIGTSPGGRQVMSAQGDSISGYRRIPAMGNVNHNTSWIIHGLPNGTYYWSVQAIDASFVGSVFATEQSFIIEVPLNVPTYLTMPEAFVLHQNFPNPFNPATTVQLDLPETADIALVVYDLLGREVVPLVDDYLEAGYHKVVWNGQDRFGRYVPTGIYIVRVRSTNNTKAIKIILMK